MLRWDHTRLRWALNTKNGALIRREVETQKQVEGKSPCEDEGEDEVTHP